MMLKQFKLNDSFPGCLKATALDKYDEALIYKREGEESTESRKTSVSLGRS